MISAEMANELQIVGSIPLKLQNPAFKQDGPLWIKQQKHHYIQESDITSKRYRYIKLGKTFGFETVRYIAIYKKHFFYFNDIEQKQFRGYCAAENIYIHWFHSKKNRYLLYLTNGSQSSIFYFQDDQFLVQIRQKLSQEIIQLNFRDLYQIQEQIGRGSFSKVFLVRNKKTKQLHAAKIINKLDKHKNFTKDIVEEEKKILSLVKSDFTYKFEQFYQEQNQFILVLEYLPGKDLMTLFKQNMQFDMSQIIEILRTILKGLLDCHSVNIIHRDLKPQNIIIDKNNLKPKIIDFGLSLLINPNIDNRSYKRCGTMGYMAPEVAANTSQSRKPYSAKCDIFSFGIIVHMILLGYNPLKGKNYEETFEKNMNCDIELDKQKIVNQFGQNCFIFLSRMLTKNPKNRYSAEQALNSVFLRVQETKSYQIQNTYSEKIKKDVKTEISLVDYSP